MVSPVFRIPLTSPPSFPARRGISDPVAGFDKCFFAGAENHLLPAALARAVDPPDSSHEEECLFSPLVLWGERGTGKSYLAYGLANLYRNVGQEVVILKGHNVTHRTLSYFRQTLARNALWILDDFDCVSWTKPCLEMLGCLLDEAAQGGWRLVFTLSSPPHQVSQLPPRIRSRLGGGMVLKLNPLSVESKYFILQELLDVLKIEDDLHFKEAVLHPPVGVKDNFFNVLLSLCDSPSDHGVLCANTLLKKIPPRKISLSKDPPLATIGALTAKHFGISVHKLRGRGRHCGVVLARQVCMYLAHEVFSHSLQAVGLYVGRDRSTVVHGCGVIQKKILLDLDLKKNHCCFKKHFIVICHIWGISCWQVYSIFCFMRCCRFLGSGF